jgi:hypothetical protein
MDQRRCDSKKQQRTSEGKSPYVEASAEAANFFAKGDLQAWGKLSAFHERFVPEAWKHPLADEADSLDGRRSRRFRRRA